MDTIHYYTFNYCKDWGDYNAQSRRMAFIKGDTQVHVYVEDGQHVMDILEGYGYNLEKGDPIGSSSLASINGAVKQLTGIDHNAETRADFDLARQN